MNASLKRPAMHSVVQFPAEVRPTEKNQRKMLDLAVRFINETHGGEAVFSARLDRDEEGQHTVDVFYAPRYEKHTKAHGTQTWISTTKHGKELCEKHRAEIERRHTDGKFQTGPRQVGMALNSEFIGFLRRRGLDIEDKQEKVHSRPDRLEPEAYKAQKDKDELSRLRRKNQNLDAGMVSLVKHLRPVIDHLPARVAQFVQALTDRHPALAGSAPADPVEPDLPDLEAAEDLEQSLAEPPPGPTLPGP